MTITKQTLKDIQDLIDKPIGQWISRNVKYLPTLKELVQRELRKRK